MPQETNLNISPYFDDFNKSKNFYRVLFKPQYPIQARELTTLQSILQNQIEQFGNNIFKEGSVVIPGQINYNPNFFCVEVETSYSGISVDNYINTFLNKIIVGERSGVRAKIVAVGKPELSTRGFFSVYINYLSQSTDNTSLIFEDGEKLVTEETVTIDGITGLTFQAGEGILNTAPEFATSIGSAVLLSEGVYFLRGTFVNVNEQVLILDPHNNNPSYRVGFDVFEEIISAEDDTSLNDNAQGFENYAAPGADRLKITALLSKRPLEIEKNENFVELLRVREGNVISERTVPSYNLIRDELARRTYEESGDYFVKPFTIFARESLNDRKGNNGIFTEDRLTYNYNEPSDDLGTFVISPGKAYIQGYEAQTISQTFLDFPKPRTTKTLVDQSINYVTGSTFILNRVYGSPSIGIGTSYTVSLRSERIGSNSSSAAGKEIGIARVYDFNLESGGYNTTNLDANEWSISLFDVQPYTEITLNQPITLSTPTYIKGKYSGAVGFLRNDANNSGIITVYNTKGTFLTGEKFLFDGIENGRISTGVTQYSISDIQSIYALSGAGTTFNADTKLFPESALGNVTITASSAGVSTVTSSILSFAKAFSVGDVVSYTNPGLSIISYARVNGISILTNSISIVGITTVNGVCDGGLPTSIISPTDFSLLGANLKLSYDDTLYTALPNKNISNVDLTESDLTIRKQYDVTITANSTNLILASANETFLPFNDSRYLLIRNDGVIEPLTNDKFTFSSGGSSITINGLSVSSGSGRLIATLRKTNIKEKVKNRTRVKSIIVDKSKYEGSGIGTTTFNDGLQYGKYPYGTRVQDDEICLNFSDVTKIHAIYESRTTSDPSLPSIVFSSISSPNNEVGDFIIGDEFYGQDSGAFAVHVERENNVTSNFIPLNKTSFIPGEIIIFKTSGITAVVSSTDSGDNDVTSNFTFDNGQKGSIYDYSKIIRKQSSSEPTRKLKVVFEYSSYSDSDDGDVTTINSYNQFDYGDIQSVNGIRNSDILDIRPKVTDYTISEFSRSPFEFLGRDFSSSGNSAKNILASDESILLSYSYYLPRIDRLFLSKDGVFQISQGEPSDNPEIPSAIDGSLEIAVARIPAYLFNINDIDLRLLDHKRYQMKDIFKLEQRIKNLEYYTTLSLLETNTTNLYIRDQNGLNRFKSGFFVDDFSSTVSQLKNTTPKNSIDVSNSELRPSFYTTALDLQIGTDSIVNQTNINTDLKYDGSLLGENVRRSSQLLTLDYSEEVQVSQPFATRVENVTPYLVTFYSGTIELTPSSDTWNDSVRLNANKIEVAGNFTQTERQIRAGDLDPQSGFNPVLWNSWTTNWTGSTESKKVIGEATVGYDIYERVETITTKQGTKERAGTTSRIVKDPIGDYSLGDRVISSSFSPYMRSRNIEVKANRLKPFTRFYSFFDGTNVNGFVFPKLLEIRMVSGVFQVGETVVGRLGTNNITFRVAASNHKYGPYQNPTEVFTKNPYDRNNNIPEIYSSTSTVLNIDTYSLSQKDQGSYFGNIVPGMILRGLISGSQAIVSDTKLISDSIGSLIAIFFIPNPNITGNPSFESGTKIFKLTSSSNNTNILGEAQSTAQEQFFAEGKINQVQENVLSVRSLRQENINIIENVAISETGKPTVTLGNIIGKVAPPPPPPPPPPPVVVAPPPPPQQISAPVSPPQPRPAPPQPQPPIPPPPPQTGLEVYTPVSRNYGTGSLQDTVGFVQQLYVSELGRRPDATGEMYWISRTSQLLAQGYSTSQAQSQLRSEFKISAANEGGFGVTAKAQPQYAITQVTNTPGTTYTSKPVGVNNVTNGIADVYRANLGRSPDAAGLAYWTEQVNSGKLTLIQAQQAIASSAEAQARRCPFGKDPLAQTFFVEQESGIYVTKVDLFFKSKDPDIPVTVQLRPVTLGTPTENVYPFSEVTISPDQINLSDDASNPTTINFEAPVYLSGSEYHSIVILSDSNEYTVWISRLGELDVTSAQGVESRSIVVSTQPILGSLFKSQNGATWSPSQFEDLKFTLYRAQFLSNGTINFYNPDLTLGNDQIASLTKDSIQTNSRRIRVGLNTSIIEGGLVLGNTIVQLNSNASANYVGSAGTATGTLSIINAGIGYTPSLGGLTYAGIALTSITGFGRDATANITISNGVAIAATIANGGTGYAIGDVVSADQIGSQGLGANLRFSITSIGSTSEIILDQVQGEFKVGSGYTMQYVNSSGITTSIDGGDVVPSQIVTNSDGLHIRVNHKNHGMHFSTNIVNIFGVTSDIKTSKLFQDYSASENGSIFLTDNDISRFATFENVGVSSTNPGYVLIGDEIISYQGVISGTPSQLTGISRGIDQTKIFSYYTGDEVQKYELSGVSLRRINTTFNIGDSDIDPSVSLDSYNLKIDMTTNGVDRSVGTVFPKLYLNETKSTGGENIKATQNIQYEILTPIVQTLIPKSTNINASIRTVSATSVNGNEVSFNDAGFESITLESNNYFTSPRMIASRINEIDKLVGFVGNKSFNLRLDLSTSNALLSPIIDLDRVGMIFTTNRVNRPILNFAEDDRVSTLENDPSAFVYATNVISLENPATSLKVLVSAYVHTNSELRALYAIFNDPSDTPIYYPFPGYGNVDEIGRTIDPSINNGLPDVNIPKTDTLGFDPRNLQYTDLEYTVNNLPPFRYFSIKMVGSSTTQVYPPKMRDFRVIALA